MTETKPTIDPSRIVMTLTADKVVTALAATRVARDYIVKHYGRDLQTAAFERLIFELERELSNVGINVQ